MELARKLFYKLEKSPFDGRYLVLNDNNYVTHFYAESDEAAIQIFETGVYKK